MAPVVWFTQDLQEQCSIKGYSIYDGLSVAQIDQMVGQHITTVTSGLFLSLYKGSIHFCCNYTKLFI